MAEGYNWMWAKQTSSNGQSLSIRGVSRQIGLFGYPDVTCRGEWQNGTRKCENAIRAGKRTERKWVWKPAFRTSGLGLGRVDNLLGSAGNMKTAVLPHGAGALAGGKLHGVAKKELLRCNGMCTSSTSSQHIKKEKRRRRTFSQIWFGSFFGCSFSSGVGCS